MSSGSSHGTVSAVQAPRRWHPPDRARSAATARDSRAAGRVISFHADDQGQCGGLRRRRVVHPTLTPGKEFSVCVTVTVRIPLLPEFVGANTATGQFVVKRDRYVDG
jgi:hypothetical protein